MFECWETTNNERGRRTFQPEETPNTDLGQTHSRFQFIPLGLNHLKSSHFILHLHVTIME